MLKNLNHPNILHFIGILYRKGKLLTLITGTPVCSWTQPFFEFLFRSLVAEFSTHLPLLLSSRVNCCVLFLKQRIRRWRDPQADYQEKGRNSFCQCCQRFDISLDALHFDIVFQDCSFPWSTRVQIALDIASGMVCSVIDCQMCSHLSLVLTLVYQNVPSTELSP